MSIETIADKIKSLIDTARKPFPLFPAIIMICSCIKRPGLSSIVSIANIIASNTKIGIPTGANPDGSPNLINAFVKNMVDEVVRAIQNDMQVQVAFKPGDIQISGTAGDRQVIGMNINAPRTQGGGF